MALINNKYYLVDLYNPYLLAAENQESLLSAAQKFIKISITIIITNLKYLTRITQYLILVNDNHTL